MFMGKLTSQYPENKVALHMDGSLYQRGICHQYDINISKWNLKLYRYLNMDF